MGANLRVRPEQLQRLGQLFLRAPEVVEDALHVFVTGAMLHLQREVVARTPTTHGTLRASILGNVTRQAGLGVEGAVGTSLGYAVPVELGAKPHWVGEKGLESLADWAVQKLGVRGEEAKSVAFAVAWKIRHKGTTGAFMFRDAFKANEVQLQARIDEMIGRIQAQLTGDAQ